MRRHRKLNILIAVVISLTMTAAVPITAYGAENEAYVYKYTKSEGFSNNDYIYANGSGSTPAYLRYTTGPDGQQQYGGYCADFESNVEIGSYYSRTTIGEAGHFSASVTGHLRAILANSVPVKSLESLQQASGVSSLDYGEAVAATQWAIWAYTNPSSPEISIPKATGTSDKEKAAYYLYNLPSKGAAYATEPIRMSIDVSQNGSQMIFDYGGSVNIIALENKVIKATDGSGNALPFTDSDYKVIVDVSGLTKDQTVTVKIEGTQTLAADAYFYNPEGGRMASQSLISWFSGRSAVAGSASGNYDMDLEYGLALLNGDKTLMGRAIDPEVDDFVFQVKDAETGEVVSEGTSDAEGNITFEPIKFYKAQAGQTFNYVVSEKAGDNPGMRYAVNEHAVQIVVGYEDGEVTTEVIHNSPRGITFVNEYTTEDTELALQVAKNLTGNKDLEEGMFEFVKTACDENGNPLEGAASVKAVNDADGMVYFPADVYEEAGEYFYLIKEVNGGKVIDGITYDAMEVIVKVTVTDNLWGQLVAEAAYPGDVIFDNCYEAAPAKVVLEGTKNLEGRELESGEFTFVLTDESGEIIDRAVNDAEGIFRFGEMTFEKEGEYSFKVYEESGDLPGVTYDTSVLTATVTVTDDGKGQMQAEIQYPENGMTFKNVYEGGKLKVTKIVTMEGMLFPNEALFFAALFTDPELTEMTEHGVGMIDMNGNAEAYIIFEDLEYGQTYYVAETDLFGNPIGSGDFGIRTVTIVNKAITVADDGVIPETLIINDYEDGTTTVDVEEEDEDKDDEEDEDKDDENKEEQKEEDKTVQTGDEFNMALFGAALALAAAGMIGAVLFRRKED